MLSELVGMSICVYGIMKLWDRESQKIRKDFREICEKAGIKNTKDEYCKCHRVDFNEYGFIIKASIPFGLGVEDIEKNEDVFRTNLRAKKVNFQRQEDHCMVDIEVITEKIKELQYEVMEAAATEIYCGYNVKGHIKVEMKTYPHILLTGGSGTGKSRLLFILLVNLLQKKNIELYLGQISKKELSMFNKCKQVQYVANTLQELYDMLHYIDQERIRREDLIGELSSKGIFNVDDYNKITSKKLKYMYIVIDEMAFVMANSVDEKEIKELKNNCLRILLDLLRAGRSSGIFVLACLQQPDKESLKPFLRRMFQCLLCMKQPSKQASQLVLGSGDNRLVKLKLREMLVQTNEEIICRTPYIDYGIIQENIKQHQEEDHQYRNIYKCDPVPKNDINNSSGSQQDNSGIINLNDWGKYNANK